ncbi:cytochrome P450 [Paucibacter sp. KBW04]|uniref:cytochrome P450 n=1 Tax=Paucibacter sp. KBW04 TaxID=2153361 RepID=UPI001E44C94C|nr:cytochrome P450 [Paucibacter sp. KBW04]
MANMNSSHPHTTGLAGQAPATIQQQGLPPGPPCRFFGLPELRAMGPDYLGFLQAQQRQHGDVVYMRLAQYRDYSFFHPEQVRELLVATHEGLIRWERGIECMASAHGHSVLIAEGEAWARKRRMLQPGFSPKKVAAFASLMVQASEEALATWPQEAVADLPFEHAMTQLTMDVILRTLFSSRADAQAREAEQALRTLSVIAYREMFWPLSAPLWAPWKAPKRRALKVLNQLIEGQIAARRAHLAAGGEDQPDLLDMLLKLQDENGQPLSDAELRDECMTTFLAGHETSAGALTWWGWCMATHPDAAAQAAAEVDAQLAGRKPSVEDIAHMPFLGQTIKEALRLYPPAPALLTRRSSQPLDIAGWHLPKGSMLRITPYLMHRDARWFPEPEAFKPERFGPEASEIPRGAYMPFGAGPRVCLGQHFALTEITLIAALLLQRYRLEPVPGAEAPRPTLNITLRPHEPLRLRLRRRGTEKK